MISNLLPQSRRRTPRLAEIWDLLRLVDEIDRCDYLRRMTIERITTPNAPTPAGHYSQGVVHNGLVFVSGQLSIDPKTREKKLGSIEEQTEQALNNVHEILKAAGSDWSKVLKMTVYVADINDWEAVNKVYTRILGEHKPARAVIPTGALHYGFLIEIEAVAATGA